MDRFHEIEETIDMAEDMGMVSEEEQWMRQEIKRLRRIEDAARRWLTAPIRPGGANTSPDVLIVTLENNPHP